ncbi:unnamed protein product [Dovyalis caffra]|uniref:PB1 domain-containing protein n=1 Tax=Dovyalis caffra TaxID=77055 RepID=A0AAV1RAM7_9ROSI|nr:unnamed protein product [Dovyalis caffra]
MENAYSFNSYPDSGESSPRSREIDFDNPTPWEDQAQQPQSYKAKFMCSYGGKIHPRPHDNQLAYIGGETKILAVDRNIKFSVMISKLAAVCGDTDVAFKYQLPGEDLDALISVTNDDDLEHMMHEYDRLFRASAKPARMRLFLFPVSPSPASFGSDGGKSDRERFVEALNSGPSQVVESTKTAANNVDFLFGLEKGTPPPPPPPVKVPDLPEIHAGPGHDDRAIGSDPLNLQAQMQRMQIREHEQQIGYNRKNSDENLVGGYAAAGGDYYMQKVPEKVPQANLPVTMPPQVTAPPGYWPEKQATGGGFPVAVTTAPGQMEQPVYMIPGPGPGAVYHAPPVMRQVTGQTGQGYYMQRMGGGPGHGPDVYREQPVYNMVPQHQHQQPPPPMGPMGVVRPSGQGVAVTDPGYAQVAYDSAVGRQVYYTAQGGVMHQQQHQQQQQQQPPLQYQGVGGGLAVSGEMRHGGGPLGPEAKVVTTKVSQASV